MAMFETHFNIVSESYSTECYASHTEKTLKPIIGSRPFVIYGDEAIYNVLDSFGLETFEDELCSNTHTLNASPPLATYMMLEFRNNLEFRYSLF